MPTTARELARTVTAGAMVELGADLAAAMACVSDDAMNKALAQLLADEPVDVIAVLESESR